MKSHVLCLASRWTTLLELVPVMGKCPNCDTILLWGNLIQNLKLKNAKNTDHPAIEEEADGIYDISSSSSTSTINLT